MKKKMKYSAETVRQVIFDDMKTEAFLQRLREMIAEYTITVETTGERDVLDEIDALDHGVEVIGDPFLDVRRHVVHAGALTRRRGARFGGLGSRELTLSFDSFTICNPTNRLPSANAVSRSLSGR